MKKASENQRNDGVLSDYCYPGCKVKELLLRQQSQSQDIVDTAMRPSQIPNRFPPPPPRRSLQFQSPDQHHGQRQCFSMPPHPWHYVSQPQPFNSMGPAHSTPVPMPPQFQLIPVNNGYNSYSNLTPDGRPQSRYSHSQRDPRVKAPETLSSQECKNSPGHDQNKAESTPERSVPMVELHKPSPQPLVSGLVKERVPLQRSDSWSPSSSQAPSSNRVRRVSFAVTNTTISIQNQVHEGTIPSPKSNTDFINHMLQKRRRESGSDDDHAKKQCVQTLGSEQKDNTGHILKSSSSQKQLELELSPDITESLLRTELSPSKPLAHIKSVPLKPYISSKGVKQACIKSMHANMVILNSPPKRSELLLKAHEESKKKDTSSTSHKEIPISPIDHTTPNKAKSKLEENKTVDLNSHKIPQKTNMGSTSCRKLHRPKKPVIPDDLNDLFTPDPLTYKVNSGHKSLVVGPDEKAKTKISDMGGSTSISSNTETPVTKPCHKEKSSTSTLSSNTPNSSIIGTPHSNDIQISLPKVSLTRLQLDQLPCSRQITATKSVMASSEKNEKHKTHETSCTTETDAAAKKISTSPTTTVKQSEDKELNNDDSLDLESDFNFDWQDFDATKSSHSSDDEQLVSLQEIMLQKTKPPDTPEKGAFSEPSTPGQTRPKRHHHVVSYNKTVSYKNSLDQMLKEINTSKKAKETETQLLTACQEDLLTLAEFEKAEEDREEPISIEQQRFLQRFSLMCSAIKEVPPGHAVFNLEKFGRIFDQNTLQLRQCMLTPQKTEQKTLLWSSHAQLKLYINIGLFQEAYSCSPCPFQVTRFLFKMMSVHSERILSEKILQVLCDIAYAAASQRVNKSNLKFKVWVPTLVDLTLVFLNMGVPFVSLYPLESLQPPFTEGDLLEDVYIKSEHPSSHEPSTFPEHNCNNILKYLSYCTGLRPRAYTDSELLLLLTVLGTVALESRLILQTTVDLYPLLYKIINNIRDWDNMMPKICLALTDLTDDHHNMCHLVHLLPDHSRGKILRRHLSLSMISKLLDGSCSYKPSHKEIQLCDLRLYLSRMQPSSLLRTIASSSHHTLTEGEEEDMASLDQQAYYLCYSLLTLVNEVTNFQIFPPHQKEHLLLLCSELERHVKCHIRESEKCLYRTKVKDLVARIDTKWHMLLQKTRPLNGKLYDYWQPLQGDVTSSQDIEEIESGQEDAVKDEREVDKTGAEMEEDEEDEDEVVEVDVTQNAPHKDTDSSMEETGLTDAAKEVVDEEIIEEATEEACDKKNDTQVEEMECEEEGLDQLVLNATKDAVKEDEAISSMETSSEDMTHKVDTTQEILLKHTEMDSTIDSSLTSTSTEPIQSNPVHFISTAHFINTGLPKYCTENS